MDNIRIVIVDDMIDITEYFAHVLNAAPCIEVLGSAYSGCEGVELVKKTNPDIVLLDIAMENPTAGIDAIVEIKKYSPDIKVIILTIQEDDNMLFAAFAAGASDYISKSASITEIVNSIQKVYNDSLALRPEIAAKLLNEFRTMKTYNDSLIYTLNIVANLTSTEFDILRDLRYGKTYKQVAAERHVEEVTIRSHAHRILKKFNSTSIRDIIKDLEHLKIFDLYNKG